MARPAKELRLLDAVRGVWRVESRDPDGIDATHIYQVDPNALRCDCRAGQVGRACHHLRLVLDHLAG